MDRRVPVPGQPSPPAVRVTAERGRIEDLSFDGEGNCCGGGWGLLAELASQEGGNLMNENETRVKAGVID